MVERSFFSSSTTKDQITPKVEPKPKEEQEEIKRL
jgi:hypothetical protein